MNNQQCLKILQYKLWYKIIIVIMLMIRTMNMY